MFLIYWHPFIKEVILLIFSSLCNTVILQKEKLFYSKKQHGTASPSRLMLQNLLSKKDATQFHNKARRLHHTALDLPL